MDDDLSLVVLADAKDRMEKAVSHTQTDFGGVRTGRATSGLVEHMRVDIYGAEVELRQVAGLSVPEAADARDLALRQVHPGRHRKGDSVVGPRVSHPPTTVP